MKKHFCPNCGHSWTAKVGRPSTSPKDKILTLRRSGMTMQKIAAKLGVSVGSVWKIINEDSNG